VDENSLTCQKEAVVQFNLFDNPEGKAQQEAAAQQEEKRERSLQNAMLSIRSRFGKNAILKAANLKEEARTIARNGEIGGHKA